MGISYAKIFYRSSKSHRFPAHYSRNHDCPRIRSAVVVADRTSRDSNPDMANSRGSGGDPGRSSARCNRPTHVGTAQHQCESTPANAALATDGVFGWTRNPLYSGGMLVIFGIALVFALDWLLLLIVPSLLVLHFGVVKREEEYLERKFGDRYRIYRSNVARYGLGI